MPPASQGRRGESFPLTVPDEAGEELTYAIRQAYVEAGFVSNGLPALPDDDIATGLAFVAYLYQQAADALRRDDKDTERWLTRKRLFVQRHLKQWAFTFCDEVIARAHTSFWQGVALLTKGLLEFEDPLDNLPPVK